MQVSWHRWLRDVGWGFVACFLAVEPLNNLDGEVFLLKKPEPSAAVVQHGGQAHNAKKFLFAAFSRRSLKIWSTVSISFRHQKSFRLFGIQPGVFFCCATWWCFIRRRAELEGCAIKTCHWSIYSLGLNQDRDSKRDITEELECFKSWYAFPSEGKGKIMVSKIAWISNFGAQLNGPHF